MEFVNFATKQWLVDHFMPIFLVLASFALLSFASLLAPLGYGGDSKWKLRVLGVTALLLVPSTVVFCLVCHEFEMEITNFDKSEFFAYLVKTPLESWCYDNKGISLFSIDGKRFAKMDGQKYLLEKADDGSVFIYGAKGKLEYGLAVDGRVERF